jgi:aminomethyltransferase
MAFDRSSLKHDFGDSAGEARACREESALFDFSFLECARVQGAGAQAAIEAYIQRSLDKLEHGAIAYAVRTDSAGAALADLTVWRKSVNSFELMSGRCEELTSLMACASGHIETVDLGSGRAVFSVQGPGALDALRRCGDADTIAKLSYFHFADMELAGTPCTVGRLGYTGEPGFEIILPRDESPRIWRELSRHARPAGFIAADALRIEAGFVLFANEFRLPVSPAEAGLGQFHPQRPMQGTELRLVCFRANTDHLEVPWTNTRKVERPVESGVVVVTSACNSAVAGGILGLGFVNAATSPDASLQDPSGQFRDIRQLSLPLYDTSKRRPRQPWR